jgi:hypothetical protein
MADGNDKAIEIRSAVDLNIVGDNILDIADFAIEKYEFRNDTTLSPDAREQVVAKTRAALWEIVEDLKLRRQRLLRTMFAKADETVQSAVADM